ncbi:MAG: hypothetical protein NVSMB2_08930 [Chloroflexota bacterium]
MPPLHHLPRQLTTLVGREHDLDETRRLLEATPLLTLSGTAGVGKTRLALETAARYADRFEVDVRFVELSPLSDPSLLVGAVAAACAVPGDSHDSLSKALAEHLTDDLLLLVLDNCEHLIEACADLVATLLQRCPTLRVLVTSREPLDIDGEVIWRVAPLGIPAGAQQSVTRELLESPAVRLFVDRARAAEPDFTLLDENASAVASICIQLDGIPLAIEIAAALVRGLAPAQLAERLEQNPRLLARSARRSLARHQTLDAAVDWSYELLSESQRALLRRLAVFAGGWSLEAAENVCADGTTIVTSQVTTLLTQLIDKSLVVVGPRDTRGRYRLLEPIRQYARRKLAEAAEDAALRNAHLVWFQAVAEHGEAPGGGPEEVASLDRVEREHDNFRVALAWALDCRDAAAALKLVAALFRFWDRRGYLIEGCRWLDAALDLADDAPRAAVARALNGAAQLWSWRGDSERALALASEAIVVSREILDRRGVAWGLLTQGTGVEARGNSAEAIRLYRESAEESRLTDPVLCSLALQCEARAHIWTGGNAIAASAALNESLSLAREAGSLHAESSALATSGDRAWRNADVGGAMHFWAHALERLRDVSSWRSFPRLLERLAWAAAAREQFISASQLLAAAERQRALLGIPLHIYEATDHRRTLAAIDADLGSDELSRSWSAGTAWGRRDALGFALLTASPSDTVEPVARADSGANRSLSDREMDVLKLVAAGHTNRQIAEVLILSPRTVKRHMDNIFDKLAVSSRAAAATAAQRAGWL